MSQASFTSADRRGTVPRIASRMKAVLANGELSDIEFAVGREHGPVKMFPAHKFALSISSDVFYTMFHGSLAKRDVTIIPIPEILPDAFANMLSYIYTDAVENLKPENVIQTLYCADKYDLPWLADRCISFVLDHIKPDTCLMFLKSALRWTPDVDRIVEKCLEVVDASSEAVFQSDHFTEIGLKTLEMVLQRDTLSADENVVYTAVEKWAEAACTRQKLSPSTANRRKMLGAALFLVRFPLLTDEQLAKGQEKSRMLYPEEVCKIFLYKHAGTKEGLKFPMEPRKHLTYRVAKCTYKPKEKVFIAYTNGYWHPAAVFKENGVDPYPPFGVDMEVPEGKFSSPTAIVRAADILDRGLLVSAYINGDYQEATYGSQRASVHTVVVDGREHHVDFMQLKIAGNQVDKWKAITSISGHLRLSI
ncbi:BTB/POZ domain-containing protein 6-B-like [Paramacrobiotus metropolitanus]|uniref:BTB/POZ domain-containing protein 6-B-like n=1 Tax=Paramacrobiotus metropolitanus TaxID=2943436 RepID=UPI0024461C13|nr:BTB/POZ domain-containing protein 6-B-like [Paramacrobiotus metropolitanus]